MRGARAVALRQVLNDVFVNVNVICDQTGKGKPHRREQGGTWRVRKCGAHRATGTGTP